MVGDARAVKKPRIGFYDFSCCEGCQLQVINLEDELVALTGKIDIVEFREAMSERADTVDIAFVEGSVTRKSEIPRLKKIRENSGLLVALGACAHLGGVNCLKNRFDMGEVRRRVYADSKHGEDTIPARPLSAVVTVDLAVPGCPIDKGEFLRIVTGLLMGRKVELADYPVCVECKRRENVCRFEMGEMCLGPIIRAGCDAICPAFGRPCDGCRGFVSHPEFRAHREVLARHGLTAEEMLTRYTLFTSYFVEDREGVCLREAGNRDE
jgi:coenzyme F420-reducing hydrogenase gamma subunit